MSKEIQTTESKKQISIGAFQGSRSLMLNSLTEIHQFATMVTKTDLVPKGYRGKPEDATVAIIYGMEIGLPPMSSLQNISVVNGTPAVWGDAQLSLVQSSGKYEYHKSSFEGEFGTDNFKAIFEVKRSGAKEPVIKEFSIMDAKKAGLWSKSGTWTSHPKVMLSYKARAFALREAFADILKGMHSAEEMEGEQIVDVTPKSKTANAHTTPPAALDNRFYREVVQTDIEEAVVEASDSEVPSVNTHFSDQEEQVFVAAGRSPHFFRVKDGLEMMTAKYGIENFWNKSATDDLKYLQENDYLAYEALTLIKNNRLEELK